jgi:Arm DNA-binding domain
VGPELPRLTARTVAALKKPGRYSDGDRLYLSLSEHSKRWVFLYSFHGKRREAGLGAASKVTLAEARNKAAECRALLASQNGAAIFTLGNGLRQYEITVRRSKTYRSTTSTLPWC